MEIHEGENYPKKIYLIVNSVCNARCKTCDVGQKNVKGRIYPLFHTSETDMGFETFKKLVDDVKECKAYIDIKGTEPLLHKDIIKFIKYCKENGLGCNITTNGFLLDKFIKDFVELGLDDLGISLDAYGEVCDEIRGLPGVFEKAADAIKEIVRLKKEMNVTKPSIRINYTISNLNHQYLEKSLEIFKELGVDLVTFQHLNFITEKLANIHNAKFPGQLSMFASAVSGGVDPKKVDIDVLYSQIEAIKENYPRSEGFYYKFVPEMTKEELYDFYNNEEKFVANCERCKFAWWSSAVKSNGDIIPSVCCYNVVFGNIKDENILDVWDSKAYNDFRDTLLRNDGFLPACSRCPGMAKLEEASPFNKSFACWD